MTLTIREVKTRADKLTFLKVPFPLYRDDPNWVPQLFFERMEHLSEKKNPYFEHAEAQLFIAERNGRPVGRISAQIDQLHLERYKDATGQFGFLEAEDDPEVFAALFAAAETWLRGRGMKRMQGPFSFSINDETGLLIDGFDTPPSMMMGHARRYYLKRVEDQGLTKAKDVIAYSYDAHAKLPPVVEKVFQRAMASPDIAVRPIDMKNLKRDLAIIMDIFNDAWSDNWNFVPFTQRELEALGTNLKLLVAPEYVSIVNYKGEPAAMAVTLPNLNEWIAGLNGRLLPFGWLKLAYEVMRKRPKTGRMPLMGVRKKYQSGLLGSSLAIAAIKTVNDFHYARGTRAGEVGWVLEDNVAMRHIIETLDSKPYKTYRVFEKAL